MSVSSGMKSVRLVTIYRPHKSKKNKATASTFFSEFSTLLEMNSTGKTPVTFIGDFNFHMDDLTDREAEGFRDLLASADLVQHVKEPTHIGGHILDLVISCGSDNVVSNVVVHKENDPDYLAEQYDTTLRDLVDKHAPEVRREITLRPNAPWFTPSLQAAKQKKRQCERAWKKSGLECHRQIFQEQCKEYHKLLYDAKTTYHKSQVDNTNDRQLFKVIDNICVGKREQILPSSDSEKDLADNFADYFASKIRDIRQELDQDKDNENSISHPFESCQSHFSEFSQVTDEDVRKFIQKSPTKSCPLDPVPTWLLKEELLDELTPIIPKLVKRSFSYGRFPTSFKRARVVPSLKKPKMDREVLKNYRPISNLSFLSKLEERIAASQIQDYLSANNLYAHVQSAYRSCHSTESALLRVQNDLLSAVDSQKEAVLVLLDLSSAFDTIDHRIFLNRLNSRYGIEDKALDWFTSYMDNRS
ncbi:uncharacterized protein [Amphiura filiformis]|uniref:uncharacterized protein n=1 Tax=Amphiura filiformis TaxID=82378 RepID=UPI003B220533